ncbi:MAG: BtrH N-terminal domain-containing protein [Campylobacterota bacterium]
MEQFDHKQFAHCESGAISSLFTQNGFAMSEPMAFGLTGTLSFVYFPFVTMANMPLIAYRQLPKNIINTVSKRLDVTIVTQKFSNKEDATEALDALLARDKIVGLQTSVFFLPYFPQNMRFHFNAHNLIVFDKTGDTYSISDPVFETPVQCTTQQLNNARFAKGIFAPKGFLYYIDTLDQASIDAGTLKKAIVKNAKSMLTPFWYAGIKGMEKLARDISRLDKKSDKYKKNFLTHIVRMQEEIGTGGGGFRYLYAAFLNEAKEYGIDNAKLEEATGLIVDSGNSLREFALLCVQAGKNPDTFDATTVSDKLLEASGYEKKAFQILKTL